VTHFYGNLFFVQLAMGYCSKAAMIKLKYEKETTCKHHAQSTLCAKLTVAHYT